MPNNTLTKIFTEVTIQPESHQEYVPGYSYKADVSQTELSDSGKIYLVNLLKSQGYKVTTENISNYIYIFYKEEPGSITIDGNIYLTYIGYNIFFTYTPKQDGSLSIPNPVYTTNAGYFTIPPEGKTINVPGQWTTVTPDSYLTNQSLIGWNGGAISEQLFNTGSISFSIKQTSVGIVIGISEQSSAVADEYYSNILYGFYFSNNTYKIFIENSYKSSEIEFQESDVFKINVLTDKVSLYQNNTLVYTQSINTSNKIFCVDCSMYYSGDQIKNISYEALTSSDGISYSVSNIISLDSSTINTATNIFTYTNGNTLYTVQNTSQQLILNLYNLQIITSKDSILVLGLIPEYLTIETIGSGTNTTIIITDNITGIVIVLSNVSGSPIINFIDGTTLTTITLESILQNNIIVYNFGAESYSTFVIDGKSYNKMLSSGEINFTGLGQSLISASGTIDINGKAFKDTLSYGEITFTGYSNKYPMSASGIFTITGIGLNKNGSVSSGIMSFTGKGFGGGIIPSIPAIGVGQFNFTGWSRERYKLPPQIMINM
jgi:hypothetical protein